MMKGKHRQPLSLASPCNKCNSNRFVPALPRPASLPVFLLAILFAAIAFSALPWYSAITMVQRSLQNFLPDTFQSSRQQQQPQLPPEVLLLSSVSSTTSPMTNESAKSVTFIQMTPNRLQQRTFWDTLPHLPAWMKQYFEWHQQQLLILNDTNWQSHRFLVQRCLKKDRWCGGASDRLQGLPVLLLWAHLQKRLLFLMAVEYLVAWRIELVP